MAAQEQDLTAKIAMSLDEIIGLNQQGGEGSPSNAGGDGDREGGRPFRRGRRFPRDSDKPYPRASSPSSASVTNRVYVGNLSWQTSWQDLKDHMRSAGGTVIHADVFLDEYGRSKGCGIVEYATREEALHSIQTLNDTKIGDSERLIFVREDRETNYFPPPRERGAPRGRRGPGPSPSAGGDVAGRQVFVRNLPFSTSWQDLKDYFKQFGRVVRAEALTNTDGTPKGQGTVLFETREDAQNAIARANNTELQGRIIGVQEDRYVA